MVLVIPRPARNPSLPPQAVVTVDLPCFLKILFKRALLAVFLSRQGLLLHPLIAAGRLECRSALRQPETVPFNFQDLVLEAGRFLDRI
jgi:hypothetical protein